MLEIDAATETDASPETVWSVLTELAEFTAGTRFIRAAARPRSVGRSTCAYGRRSASPWRSAPPCNRELRWTGHVLAPWLARGDHSFTIASNRLAQAHHTLFVTAGAGITIGAALYDS